MHDEPRLEEQALDMAAEIAISTQVDEAEKIDVDVQTDLLKIVQGQADSVAMAGKGVVIQEGIRVQEMELHTDSIAINPLSALFGQIELNHSVDADARLVLTEEDINCALNSDFIRSKMESLDLNVDGKIVSIKLQQMKLLLPGNGKIAFSGKSVLHETGNTRQVGFTGVIRPRTLSQPLMLEGFNCMDGGSISIELTVALMEKLKELVNLPYFELEGMALRIKDLEVQEGSLTVYTDAHVTQIPSQLQ